MDPSLLVCRTGEAVHSCPGPSPHLADSTLMQHVGLAGHPVAGKKNRSAMLWGTGSALLSGLGFVALALFEQYNGMVCEMRTDLKHFNETQSNFVKREHFDKLKDKLRENFREYQEARTARGQLDQELRVSEKARADMAQELQRLRERLAYLEGRQIAVTPKAEPTAPSGN